MKIAGGRALRRGQITMRHPDRRAPALAGRQRRVLFGEAAFAACDRLKPAPYGPRPGDDVEERQGQAESRAISNNAEV